MIEVSLLALRQNTFSFLPAGNETTIYLMESAIRPQYSHYRIFFKAIRPLIFESDHYIFLVPGWK